MKRQKQRNQTEHIPNKAFLAVPFCGNLMILFKRNFWLARLSYSGQPTHVPFPVGQPRGPRPWFCPRKDGAIFQDFPYQETFRANQRSKQQPHYHYAPPVEAPSCLLFSKASILISDTPLTHAQARNSNHNLSSMYSQTTVTDFVNHQRTSKVKTFAKRVRHYA